MEFDYFYGQQAEQFTFYSIPKVLFTDSWFWNVSTDAKLLYGILLDRMNLSARNGWTRDVTFWHMKKQQKSYSGLLTVRSSRISNPRLL